MKDIGYTVLKFLVYSILISLFFTSASAINIDDHLALYYNFSQTCEDAANGNSCTFVDSPTSFTSSPDQYDNKGYKTDGNNDCIKRDITHVNPLNANEFTTCFWVNQTTSTGTVFGFANSPLIYDIRGDGTNLEYYIRDSGSNARVSPNPYDADTGSQDYAWHFVCWRLGTDDNIDLIIDGTIVDTKATTTSSGSWTEDNIALGCVPYEGSETGFHAAEYDEWSFFSKEINMSHIIELYNGTDVGTYCDPIQNPTGCTAGGGDSTPPVVTFENQFPTNFTISDIEDEVYINYTITDETNLNISTIYMNFSTNFTTWYINGTLQDSNFSRTYNTSSGNVYGWEVPEYTFISGSFPLHYSIIESNDILNDTLESQNQWIKMQFFNVSNDRRQAFAEIMDRNASFDEGLIQYYYCNSNYTSGNVLNSEWCTLFYSVDRKGDPTHTHGNRWHRVLPMGINITTGTLNGLYVTPTSYILKRGSPFSDRYYYTSTVSRASQSQSSGNSGVTWSNIAGTVDSHIHFIHEDEAFEYFVCAEDDSENSACSTTQSDLIDFPLLNPNSVIIYEPLAAEYNNTITINHSASFSASGQDILTYAYAYATNGSTSFTNIDTNNHPTTTYSWDISNFLNGAYYVRIIITDSSNLTTTEYSEVFTIENDLTVDQQLLTSIDDTLDEIIGVINMIPIFLMYIILLTVSFFLFKNRENVFGGMTLLASFGVFTMIVGLLYNEYWSDMIVRGVYGDFLAIGSLVFIFIWLSTKLGMIIVFMNKSFKPS